MGPGADSHFGSSTNILVQPVFCSDSRGGYVCAMARNLFLHKVRLEFLGILAAFQFCVHIPAYFVLNDWWIAAIHTSVALFAGLLFMYRRLFREPWMTELLLHMIAIVAPIIDLMDCVVDEIPGAIYIPGRIAVSMVFAFLFEHPVFFIKVRLAMLLMTMILVSLLCDCFAEFKAAGKEYGAVKFLSLGFLVHCPSLLTAGTLYVRVNDGRLLPCTLQRRLGRNSRPLLHSPAASEDSSTEVWPAAAELGAQQSAITDHNEMSLRLQTAESDYLEEGHPSSSHSNSTTSWQVAQRAQREQDKESLLSLYLLSKHWRLDIEPLPYQAIDRIACFLRTSLPKSSRVNCVLELPDVSDYDSSSSSFTGTEYYHSNGSVTDRWNELRSFVKEDQFGLISL